MDEQQEPVLPLSESMSLLAGAINVMSSEVSFLRRSVDESENIRKRNFRRAVYATTALFVVLMSLLAMFVVMLRIAGDTHSCAVPTGACYIEQQHIAQAAQANLAQVANNNRYFTLVVARCTVGTNNRSDFESCVKRLAGKAYPSTPR